MRVSKLILKNFCQFEAFELEFGKSLTRISGRNSAGKTTLISALKTILEGGTDASLVRTGEKVAEEILILDDGTKLRKRIPAEGDAKLEGEYSDQTPVPKVKSYLSKLVDAFGANPIKFLAAPKKERLDVLLEAMPIKVSPEELIGATAIKRFGEYANERDGLKSIALVRKEIFEARTKVNGEKETHQRTASSLRAALPKETPADATVQMETAMRELTEVQNYREAQIKELDGANREQVDQLKAEAQEAIDFWKQDLAERIASRQQRLNEDLAKVRQKTDELRATIDEDTQPRMQAAQAEIARLNQLREEVGRGEQVRKMLAETESKLKEVEARSSAYTLALKRLDALKVEKVKAIDIDGVSITEDGEIMVGDVPYDRVNTAEQVRVACQIAQKRLAGKDLPLLFMDGAECLDDETMGMFEEYMREHGIQAVFADVITSKEAEALSAAGVPEVSKGLFVRTEE